MIRLFPSLVAAVFVAGAATHAHAGQNLTFDVPAAGGVYEVPVHPGFVTVFYFPSEVINGSAHDQNRFVIGRERHTVSVRPLEGAAGMGNVTIECATFRVGIVLRVVEDPGEAAIVVSFHDQDAEEAFQKQVAEQVASLRAELMRKTRMLDQLVNARVRERVARDLLQHHGIARSRAIARTRDNVVVRVQKIIWIGKDAYLELEIENRSDKAYRLDAVEIHVNGKIEAGPLILADGDAAGGASEVRPGRTARGVICVPEATRWIGAELILAIEDATNPRRALTVRALLRSP